jgi:hypothetical protein
MSGRYPNGRRRLRLRVPLRVARGPRGFAGDTPSLLWSLNYASKKRNRFSALILMPKFQARRSVFVVAADLIHSMAVERLVERANAGQKNSADDCRVWHDGRAHLYWHDLHVWLALVSAGHQQPSWCPSVSESAPCASATQGTTRIKPPPVFHGMPGWGESGGTYPLPLLETDFRDAQAIDFAGGIFRPVSYPLPDDERPPARNRVRSLYGKPPYGPPAPSGIRIPKVMATRVGSPHRRRRGCP